MIKAVIFDFGGVMKEKRFSFTKIFNVSEEGIRAAKEKTIPIFMEFNKGVIDEEEFCKRFALAINKPLPKDCVQLFGDNYSQSIRFFPEMMDLVKKLKNIDIKTAVLSNISKFQASFIRENGGYQEFDEVVLSYEEKIRKPDTDFYKIIIEKLKIKPQNCIFIDDKEKNLPPAQSLGMKTILFENPKQVVHDVMSIIKSKNS